MTVPNTATRAAVLRAHAVGDVEPGENLHARDERRRERTRQQSRVAQHAVDAMPDGDPLLFRLEVDVARTGADRFGEQLIDEPNDRRGIVGRGIRARGGSKPMCCTSTGGVACSPRVASGYERASCCAISGAEASTHRTLSPVAKATARSASRSRGLLVATTSAPASRCRGTTPYRRAHRSGRRATAAGSVREKSARDGARLRDAGTRAE